MNRFCYSSSIPYYSFLELCLDEWDQAGLSSLLNTKNSGSSWATGPFQGTSLEAEELKGGGSGDTKPKGVRRPLKGGEVPRRLWEEGIPAMEARVSGPQGNRVASDVKCCFVARGLNTETQHCLCDLTPSRVTPHHHHPHKAVPKATRRDRSRAR